MGNSWSHDAVSHLLSETECPRCGEHLLSGVCPDCKADLRGPAGQELWDASVRAAGALEARQAMVERLPSSNVADAPAEASTVVAAQPIAPVLAQERASSQISVQSLLAVAGAGLFAVAAIVFTFFNPDLTNFGTRTAIIAAITVLFLGGAWFLARKGLQLSAEAIGALGMVFAVLDVWAFSTLAPPGVSDYVFTGLGAFASSAVMIVIAALARIRTWLWASIVGLAITPAFFGYATGHEWGAVLGHLCVGLVALLLHEAIRGLSPRFGSELRAERVTASMIQIVVMAMVLIQLLSLNAPNSSARVLGTAAIVAALAALAAFSARTAIAGFWSYFAGALGVGAVSLLPFALERMDQVWQTALVPLAAAITLAGLGMVRPAASIRASPLRGGAVTIATVGAIPSIALGLLQLWTPLLDLLNVLQDDSGIVEAAPSYALVPSDAGLTAMLGLAFAAAGLFALSLRSAGPGARAFALWLGMLALLTLTGWGALARPAQVAIGLGLALVLTVLLTRVKRLAAGPIPLRLPLTVAAHLLPVVAVLISWADSSITVVAGAAAVAVLAVVAQIPPRSLRPVYVGVGYAYSLFIFATALNLLNVELIALLCLVTSLASVCALAATLTRWLAVRSWYAVLLVTSVPFLIGVGSVLEVRSGWTALSTGLTFALALSLLLTRRPGLNVVLRAAAAALLVPALAVVVISLGAQVLAVSASPITLPIIAVIVAATLPSTGQIGAALLKRGLPEADARASRLWIEISALVTAALAVVLALVRVASGYDTTLLVLLIVGIGAGAAAHFGRRRYGWWVAGAAWTGALWCVWAIAGVGLVEAYLLPPALGAAIIGAILVGRGRAGGGPNATGLYATGLACAVVPSLVILAVAGSGINSVVSWRSIGLLASAVLLIAIGSFVTRGPASTARRLRPLGAPTFIVAIAVAAGGAIQAVRYARGLDSLGIAEPQLVMLPVLGLSILGMQLAATSARLVHARAAEQSRLGRSRWLYAPATLYLVAGPIAAVRPGWLPIWTLWVLAVLLLALMLITVAVARMRRTALPPVWFTFSLAWVTAVAGWSERELRVEAFSLPLGLALLGAGIIALRASPQGETVKRRVTSWPIGFSGSWRLLAPGIIVTLLPSVLATGTDPLTWRAITVIALALAAILVGSLLKLGAPFLLGLLVLPIENIIVFVVQIGRSIGAAPWWITLATAGAVLLVIAVTSERRASGERGGVAARLRDLA